MLSEVEGLNKNRIYHFFFLMECRAATMSYIGSVGVGIESTAK